jgi:Uma2 family endonuclease
MLIGEKQMTAEELFRLPKLPTGEDYELVKGVLLIIFPPGVVHGNLASRLAAKLQTFVEARQLGETFVETGFRLEGDPDTVLAPDVSFVSATRIPQSGLPEGFFPGAPDLAVEIVSPNHLDEAVQAKVAAYLQAGSRLVWVVRPKRRTITVHRPDGTARTLSQKDNLSGDEVLPGLSLSLHGLFS